MQDFEKLKNKFKSIFEHEATDFFSAPGRTEICGNHLDHQHGMVMAAAVDVGINAAVRYREDKQVQILSDGFGMVSLFLNDLSPRADEEGTTQALVRGVARALSDAGIEIRGFAAVVSSDVPAGGGLSSSAAFEVLIGNILAPGADPVFLAKAGQYAENVYFGKPSGLMDQLACSVGGMVFMDLEDPENPKLDKLNIDFSKFGYSLCLVNTGGSHADLTDQYAAIPAEMRMVAESFGKSVLREVDADEFSKKADALKSTLPERAVMRAEHFFAEEARVLACKKAVLEKDIEQFLDIINESGKSSRYTLQNVTAEGEDADRSLERALDLSAEILKGRGAVRVHGGGFAGSIQAFVPTDVVEEYIKQMDEAFGAGACRVYQINPEGGKRI